VRGPVGDLVAFEDVRERTDGDAEVVEHAKEREDLILAIAVAVDPPLAAKDLGESLELEVSAERQPVRITIPLATVAIVGPCGRERVAEELLDAHARLRIARRGRAAIAPLDVLAERELDPGRRLSELQLVGDEAPAELDHLILTSDRIGRAVEDVRRREAAGELAIDIDIVAIEEIADANLRGDRLRPFVDPAIGRHVRVAVD